jgi:hypothetical protein
MMPWSVSLNFVYPFYVLNQNPPIVEVAGTLPKKLEDQLYAEIIKMTY